MWLEQIEKIGRDENNGVLGTIMPLWWLPLLQLKWSVIMGFWRLDLYLKKFVFYYIENKITVDPWTGGDWTVEVHL